MHTLLDVIAVQTRPGYRLLIDFENGESRLFDMRPYLGKRPFTGLEQPGLFDKASVELGTVVWPGEIDIAPETLYDKSFPVATGATLSANSLA